MRLNLRALDGRSVLLAILASVTITMMAFVPVGVVEAKKSSDVSFWLTILHNNDGESELIASKVLDQDGNFFSSNRLSYQQALSSYIQAPEADGGLGGVIRGADYPVGGEERIVRLN
jgi:hypothetical protein